MYENIQIGSKDYVEPPPHKYNPESAAAAQRGARAGSSNDAIVLGTNSSFKRSAIVTGKPLAKRMTADGRMLGAAPAPQPKWTARPVADGSSDLSATPAPMQRSSSWSDAGRNWHEASAAWEQSRWWTRGEWRSTSQNDAVMTDAHGDNTDPWSSSAEPHVP